MIYISLFVVIPTFSISIRLKPKTNNNAQINARRFQHIYIYLFDRSLRVAHIKRGINLPPIKVQFVTISISRSFSIPDRSAYMQTIFNRFASGIEKIWFTHQIDWPFLCCSTIAGLVQANFNFPANFNILSASLCWVLECRQNVIITICFCFYSRCVCTNI